MNRKEIEDDFLVKMLVLVKSGIGQLQFNCQLMVASSVRSPLVVYPTPFEGLQ